MSCVRRIMRGSGNFRQECVCVEGGGRGVGGWCSGPSVTKKLWRRSFFFQFNYFSPQLILSDYRSPMINFKEKILQLMAQFRIFPSSESRHSFVANYTSAVKFKIHILVLFCCSIISLYVSERKYL